VNHGDKAGLLFFLKGSAFWIHWTGIRVSEDKVRSFS